MGKKYLILGGGIAGLTAAETIRGNCSDANITILEQEEYRPYLRPLLSKAQLRAFDPSKLEIHSGEWYQRKRIDLKTNCRVNRIDAARQIVHCADGNEEPYDKLIYAAGSGPVIPPVPGSGLPGVFTVRTIRDIRSIHRACVLARHAVVIGGGVIGVELAQELKAAGLAVTILERGPKLLGRFLDEESAEVFRARLSGEGIECRTNVGSMEIDAGPDGRAFQVSALCREAAGEVLWQFPAELVILSCGVRPSAELLRKAGAVCERGVVVNEGMETSLENIYAAGDCIQWAPGNPGLWTFAQKSGLIAGLSAVFGSDSREVRGCTLEAGGELIYSSGSLFLYAFGELQGEVLRDLPQAASEPVFRVNPPAFSGAPYRKLFYENGNLKGAVLINSAQDFGAIREALWKNRGVALSPLSLQQPQSVLLLGSVLYEAREPALEIIALLPEWELHTEDEWRLEYDYLFRGCDADFNGPLWASVCQGERVLCNQTTLEVLKEYYAAGYQPAYMDGNPVDYIGDQFRYLYYLTAAGEDDRARRFEESYTMDNQKLLLEAMEKRGTFAAFLEIGKYLLQVLAGHRGDSLADFAQVFGIQEKLPKLKELLEPYSREFSDVGEMGLRAPIKLGAPRVIPTGGCNNCGGKCVIRPTIQEGCMLRIESDTGSNNPQIRACVRGRGYRKTFLSMDRLRYPMKRVGERGSGKFRRLSWDEAVKEIAEEWKRIRDTYGPASRYVNYATGVTGIMRPDRLAKRLLAADGGYLDSFGSYSSACASYIAPYIFGNAFFGNSPADFLNTRLLVFWGDNSTETIFGSERNYYLSKMKEKNIKVICIDPRFSQTAVAYADEWIPIRPSTDSALADAVAYTILLEGLQDQNFMDTYCLGFDEDHMPQGVPKGESYRSYLFGLKDGVEKTPEWAEPITGIPAERIRAFARELAGAKPACIVAGHGIQRTGNGEQATKAIAMLAALTGNIGISGGNAGGNGMTREHQLPTLALPPIPNPYKGAISMFLWTRAIEHSTEMTAREDRLHGVERLDSSIRMILNLAGNTLVNQHSDINDTIRILKNDELCQLIVCSDIFMTSSARYGDYVLPGTSVFETDNITAPWRGGNYLIRNNKVIEPLFECRFDWEWLKDMASELGHYEAFTAGEPDLNAWLRKSYLVLREKEPELPDYEAFCEQSGWQYREKKTYIAYEREIADPENHPFKTPSGKIEIFSKTLYDLALKDVPAIPQYVPCPEGPEDPLRNRFPLQLIGWHTRRRCHSVHDNNEWQEEVERPGVWIHPEDAEVRGIIQGDMVQVFNARGMVEIPAVITRRIIPGTVAMSQGGWYTPDEKGVDHRGSINVLTDAAHPTPLAKGNPQHTNLVEIRKNRIL